MGFELDSKRGVYQHYGVRTVDSKFGGNIDDDIIKTAVWTFVYNDLPTGLTSNLNMSIPANARIIDAKMEIITGFTSTSTTTDLNIGLEQADGTDINLTGLITAAEATQTAIATAGNIITGAGALVGATIGAAAGELYVAGSAADLLTGKARIFVRYITAGV